MSRRDVLIVFVTCPNATSARRIAKALLAKRLIACANLLCGVDSWFWWKGKIERSNEVLLLIKTVAAKFDEVRRSVVAHHPYQVPEVLAVASAYGHRPYLAWIRACILTK